jgi:hypothetical protein
MNHIEINGKLEVKPEDEDVTFTWYEAHKILKDGWRLPTKADELNEIFKNKESLGGFATASYWSSSESNSYDACHQYFFNGLKNCSIKSNTSIRVRAVRAINLGEENEKS